MAEGSRSWGVTEVVVRYVSGDETWEVSMDPKEIDILVFNWERFRKINEVVGAKLTKENHVRPDGRRANGTGGPPDEVAKRIGFRGPPRKLGPRQSGTTEEPMCVHNRECTWWCVDESHDHQDEMQ